MICREFITLEFIGYTEDLADLIDSHQLSHHLYADDTQVIASTTTANAELTVDRLQKCVTGGVRPDDCK